MGRSDGLQATIGDQVTLSGVGVHSGAPVSMTMHPADVDTGILFQITDPRSGKEAEISAEWRAVTATELCTVLAGSNGVTIATVEHLMAALRGLMIDNVIIEIEGVEVPVMDGSSGAFVDAIDSVGRVVQSRPRRFIEVLKPVRVDKGDAYGELRPYNGSRLEVTIDFPTPLIGRQSFEADLSPTVFRRDLARARTFGLVRDVEKLWQLGYALGSSLENSVAIADDRVLNPEGTRWSDEFVRHKALDAVGDLALSGLPILGLYRSYKGGHRLNFTVLQAMFADPTAWRIVEGPVRRSAGHAEVGAGLTVPAMGPDYS
ncbi:MAG: UDP-3-O-acyl-N-acetylglucosamine deacetylase [Hyphomicrobiales bacterium]|nr:MAG: UDP-3-O-acyl-N-acetylglucosamine deacetylase [Hyphomicrobiales bacterium]